MRASSTFVSMVQCFKLVTHMCVNVKCKVLLSRRSDGDPSSSSCGLVRLWHWRTSGGLLAFCAASYCGEGLSDSPVANDAQSRDGEHTPSITMLCVRLINEAIIQRSMRSLYTHRQRTSNFSDSFKRYRGFESWSIASSSRLSTLCSIILQRGRLQGSSHAALAKLLEAHKIQLRALTRRE